MKPHVTVHMMAPLDGRLDSSDWTRLPDDRDPAGVFEAVHDRLESDAWMCGRVTMGEFVTGEAHPPADPGTPSRPLHVVRRDADGYAIGLDPEGRLHFAKDDLGDEHFIMLLGAGVSDAHLAELAGDGVSYIVADDEHVDLAAMLDAIGREWPIRRLLVEGGGGMNGSMLKAGLVDAFSLALVPAIGGKTGARAIVEAGDEGLRDAVTLTLTHHDLLDGGVMWLRYAVDAV